MEFFDYVVCGLALVGIATGLWSLRDPQLRPMSGFFVSEIAGGVLAVAALFLYGQLVAFGCIAGGMVVGLAVGQWQVRRFQRTGMPPHNGPPPPHPKS